jgi:hypothetical protein
MSDAARHIADLAERWITTATGSARTAAGDDALAALLDLAEVGPALDRLGDAYGLSPFERDLIVLVGLPDEHEVFAELARLRHPHGEPRATFATLALVLDLDATGRRHLRRALVDGPLARAGIVVGVGTAPLPERGLHLAEGLWDVFRGTVGWPASCTPLADPPPIGVLPALGELATIVTCSDPHVVVVSGGRDRPAEELSAHVHAALAEAGRSATLHRASSSTSESALLLGVHAVARGVVPVLVGTPSGPPLREFPGAVVVCPDPGTTVALDDRRMLDIALPTRALGDDVAMWHAAAPELNGDAAGLAGLLRVDAVRATRAVADARSQASMRGVGVDVDDIVRQVRRRSDAQLPPTVRRITPTARPGRLVTTPANTDLLRSIVERVRGQVRVLHDWGFSTVGGARGIRALFCGPPGTGKTLSAEVVAAELGLDLLTVDLSALVSKWLGETEKNIGEVFDAAERCQAVLFFDEADAIFGRRTDGSDAHARWANLETAYLLTRIDDFDGLVVLATNLRSNIDDAFVRRLDVVVEFQEPGIEERHRLWTAHLPAAAPLAADVDIEQLSELYPVTGGVIRNASLVAAFDAASRDAVIDQRTLIDSIQGEYQKAGRSFPGVPRELAHTQPGGG